MLFAIIVTPRGGGEEEQKRGLQVFTNWTPPAGLEFRAHYFLVTGGSIGIVEANSAATLLESITPFTSHFDFETVPIVEAAEAVPIVQRAFAWRDGVR